MNSTYLLALSCGCQNSFVFGFVCFGSFSSKIVCLFTLSFIFTRYLLFAGQFIRHPVVSTTFLVVLKAVLPNDISVHGSI